VGVPVIEAAGQPLRFSRWEPDIALVEGPFRVMIPAVADYFEPEILIVPLLAFDARCNRLGYGGGFYDRTLEVLRSRRPTLAIGFAFAAQQTDALPLEPTDQPLDMVVTEGGVLTFGD
jgi:5-formyltetrahydrofolate cyclo-ligase